MKGKNIYSVLHMDRLIFGLKNLQIYKELPIDRRIIGFWMLFRKSTNLQKIALYLDASGKVYKSKRHRVLHILSTGIDIGIVRFLLWILYVW